MTFTLRSSAFVLVLAAAALSGCSKNQSPAAVPLVESVSTEIVSPKRPSANLDAAPSTQAIRATVVADKAALLSQEFLYGADLQYSSHFDAGMDLYNQSLAIGHVPARFRIVESSGSPELQLVADNRRLYPSEVNHPEQLIARYRILAQTESTLTLSHADSAVFLAQVFEATRGEAAGQLFLPKGQAPRDHWARSFEFAAEGNYLLQQTSVVLADGTIAEFMEAVFPRAAIAPGADFKEFEMDPANPKGGDEGIFERFRLLGGERIFDGEKKLTFAQHFDISKTASNPEGTIDWYATRNIPDEAIAPVRDAVEGWNRYYRGFKGIERDVVRFRGRLPEGIHLGDPRFNVINWDNRRVAGAAYESQATDPHTGKQSHSLIYMPAAWLQIGQDYWKNGRFSDSPKTAPESVVTRLRARDAVGSARPACYRELRAAAETPISGRLPLDEVKTFGLQLLKGTLFHEVGHALGLAHNFKGSLVFDRSKPGSIFSTSIMDYNDFEIERAAFTRVDGADGPQLEYDRQFLSAVYNEGKDIAESDATLPLCNDEEADAEENGVDPLCVRYDIEKDPTLAIGTAFARLESATLASDVTLAQAFARVPELVLTDEALSKAKTQDDLKALAAQVAASLKGAGRFYLTSGKASLSRVVRMNIRALLKLEDGVLLEGYSERELRERTFDGVRKALALKELPAAMSNGLWSAIEASHNRLLSSENGKRLETPAFRKELLDLLVKAIDPLLHDEAIGLPKVRSTILASLARHKKVPFFFGKHEGHAALVDYEAAIVGLLGDSVTDRRATESEREAAATSLATFAGRPQGEAAIEAVKAGLAKARAEASDNDERELIESLLGALKPSAEKEEE